MDRALVEFEIMNTVCSLADALTVVAEARPTVNLRDGTLHQVTLVAHQFVARAICHRLDASTESTTRVTTLLHIRS